MGTPSAFLHMDNVRALLNPYPYDSTPTNAPTNHTTKAGSGKSYTTLGGKAAEDRGIIVRSCESLFEAIGDHEGWGFQVTIDAFEIHAEIIRDLLSSSETASSLEIRASDDGVIVEGLSSVSIDSADSAMRIIDEALSTRVTKATGAVSTSSSCAAPSHLIFSSQ